MVDVITRFSNGSRYRERRRLTTRSKSAAQRWGEDRERHLLQHGLPQPKKEVPTLEQFAPKFLDGHARANRQKPSGIAAKENIVGVHLIPLLGTKRLDAITNMDVQELKAQLRDRAPKTVNNVLGVLSVLLKKAVEWEVLERMPCVIRLLPIPKPSARFHDFGAYEQLVSAAEEIDPRAHLIVLLGGEAGLRCGEIAALEWADVDLQKRQLCVQRSEWKGHVTVPKGGRLRYVPMTNRLATALREHRHLRTRPSTVSGGWDVVDDQDGRGPCSALGTSGRPGKPWRSCASPHLLLTPGNAWRPSQSHSGTGGTSRHRHDAALHASESGGSRCGHSVAGIDGRAVHAWQHGGNGDQRVIELLQMEQVSWGG